MVDITETMEKRSICVETVEPSESRTLVAIKEGRIEDRGSFGKMVIIPVEMDGKRKDWYPNYQSKKNMSQAYGKNTKNWVGKPVIVEIVNIDGKETVIGTPIPQMKKDDTTN